MVDDAAGVRQVRDKARDLDLGVRTIIVPCVHVPL